jgi:hypothetical protein
VEHLVIYFKHGIQDLIPYCDFIAKTRLKLERSGAGEYLGDDMAIDGGDAEGVFACRSARELFTFLREDLGKLTFMSGAKVTLVFGALDADAPREEFYR